MKSNTNNEPKLYVKVIILTILIWTGMFIAVTCDAQEKKASEWKEINSTEIPYNIEIHTGFTRNNNPKYWIEIQGIKVTISENNYNKFINKEVKLVLVEWYNPTTDKYKYTTRQAEKVKSNNKLNINELW
jgi:hypothetical protein